ncbi:hypothetical protein J2S50_006548 [Streptomyces sp. DSM 40167]|nr:hypothetical protein [Streptomyces sp. DSM 40167]
MAAAGRRACRRAGRPVRGLLACGQECCCFTGLRRACRGTGRPRAAEATSEQADVMATGEEPRPWARSPATPYADRTGEGNSGRCRREWLGNSYRAPQRNEGTRPGATMAATASERSMSLASFRPGRAVRVDAERVDGDGGEPPPHVIPDRVHRPRGQAGSMYYRARSPHRARPALVTLGADGGRGGCVGAIPARGWRAAPRRPAGRARGAAVDPPRARSLTRVNPAAPCVRPGRPPGSPGEGSSLWPSPPPAQCQPVAPPAGGGLTSGAGYGR